jgi:HSP20 family protein
MALTLMRRREPFGQLSNFERDIDRWFGADWFGLDARYESIFNDFMETNWTPAIDLKEKDGKYIITAELPGMKKEDIHVELKDGYLTLRGERTNEKEDKKKKTIHVERSYGSFERSIKLPEGVKAKDLHAKFKNGVLELTVPVPESVKRKTIEVKIE